jgi:hypothetical protein
MHIVDNATRVVAPKSRNGFKGNKDGQDGAAAALIEANRQLPVRALVLKLKDAGIERSKSWVDNKRYEILQRNGGKLTGQNESTTTT